MGLPANMGTDAGGAWLLLRAIAVWASMLGVASPGQGRAGPMALLVGSVDRATMPTEHGQGEPRSFIMAARLQVLLGVVPGPLARTLQRLASGALYATGVRRSRQVEGLGPMHGRTPKARAPSEPQNTLLWEVRLCPIAHTATTKGSSSANCFGAPRRQQGELCA
jgi:hypothetical protein